MAKEVLSIRISAAAKARLGELAEFRGARPGDIVDDLILHAGDEPGSWVTLRSDREAVKAARKADVRAGRAEGEKLVRGLEKAGRGRVAEGVVRPSSAKRRDVPASAMLLSKDKWK